MDEVMNGVTSDTTHHTPSPQRINRRRLLLSAAAGLGALAVPAGARWWAVRENARGPRLWDAAAGGGRVVPSADPRGHLYVAGYDGSVRALDPGTGTVRWAAEVSTADDAGNRGGWPLAEGGGVVCVNSATKVQVFDAASGERRWEIAVPDWRDLSTPQGVAVVGDSVITVEGASLRAFDAATGQARWIGPPVVSGAPLVAGDTVYLPGRSAGLLAFDVRSGEQRWAQDGVGFVLDPPVVHGGIVCLADTDLAAGGSTVFALDAATGRVLWKRAQRSGVTGPVAAGGAVCLLKGDRLLALDAATGDERWTATVPPGMGRGMSSLTAADGAVYVGTNDDRLFAYDLTTGRLRWQDEPEHLTADTAFTWVSLAAAGSAVYRGSRTGLRAFAALPRA
ncbi:PQQ-binding-like beta-propeller repeat protein [Kitasatospora sp. NPDC057692]|uniref:outer membrane protein assembly factor BamB family protein n=1 Tax=Kitasatospora sp. NPDC057692 TaxID=3346215 RepID=UPI0036ACCDB6